MPARAGAGVSVLYPATLTLVRAWEEHRADGDRARLDTRVAPLKKELRSLLERAARKTTKTKCHRLFITNLLKHWPALCICPHRRG